MRRALAWRGPAVIAADFNMDATKTHIWPVLQMAGWVEAHSHAGLLGQPTLPTYGESTKIDSMFISPCLAGAIRQIETIRSFAFPCHHPLSVEFDLGEVKSFRQTWKVPKELTPVQLQAIQEDRMNECFVDAFSQSNQDSSVPHGASLEGWSEALETAFSNSLRLAGEKGLSRSQRGRGGPPIYRKTPINCTTKLARSGDFVPSTVFGSVKYNQIVRQVRRLMSLHRLLSGRSPNSSVVQSDWLAILSAKGFGDSFRLWWQEPLPDEPNVELVGRMEAPSSLKNCSRSEDLKQDDSATRTFFGGVATISVPQARLCTEVLNTQAWQSTRYLEVVSRINHIQILSITLYLHPCGEDWQLYKKQANEDLLEFAMQRSLAWKGPAVIAADFNMDPTKAHIWPALQMAGWVEAHSHACVLGQPTLPTFGDATKIDSIFISPCLAGTIRKIETIRSFAFPSHHPLTVEFDLGKVKSFRQMWKVPKALTSAQLQAIQEDHMNEHFVDAFAQSNQDSSVPNGASLEGWSEALETAFSNSLRLTGEKGLSRSQTGRGGPPVYRKIPINCTTKLARSGDFEPSTVYGSTKYNQIVRQVRRLFSLKRQLLGRSPNPLVMQSDWLSILSAK